MPERVREAAARSLASNSVKHYNAYLARFEQFCSAAAGLTDWRLATLAVVLDFLCSLVAEGVARPASVLDQAIAALRHAFVGSSLLSDEWVGRVRRGLIAQYTTRTRNVTAPIPAGPVCDWLRRLPENDALSYVELRRKVAVLAAMVLIARPADLTCLRVDAIREEPGGHEMTVALLAFKNDYHRDGASLVVQACSEPKLCFIRAVAALRRVLRTRYIQPAALFMHEHKNSPLAAASIGHILKEACRAAGMEDFTGRNFRPGGATRGLAGGLPLDLVMHIGRWRDSSTVLDHYVRSERPAGVTDVLMGIRGAPSALDATRDSRRSEDDV